MSEGGPAQLRIAVVAAAPALRAGLSALLAADPGLQPVPLDGLMLTGDNPDAIVLDYSLALRSMMNSSPFTSGCMSHQMT